MADTKGTEMQEKRRRSSAPAMNMGDTSVAVIRSPMTQIAFDEVHLKQEKDTKAPLGERIRSKLYCDKKRCWKLLTGYVPVIRYLRYYKPKEFTIADLFAGLTVGILHIPQGLAFGALASVKIENGLFTSVWPVLLYVFFGTSAHVSIGTSAVICILTAGIVDKLGAEWASDKPWLTAVVGNATPPLLDEVPAYLDYKEGVAMAVAFIAGLWMIGLGIFKLGFITYYLSDSFFAAFTSAAAVHIGTSQLPAMLGIKIPRSAGVFKIIYTYQNIINAITGINWAAVITAIVVCVIIQLVKDCINERFKHKLPAPIPIELFIVIIATIISYFGKFEEQFGVDVVGSFPNTLPPPRIPTEALAEAPKFIVDAFVLAILIFANTIAMAKICAKKHNYEVDDSQELIAYGMCNAVSSFFLCFPSSVAPPRSMVASNMNARTTLSGIPAAVVMLCVILFIGPLFYALPKCALAAIIFIALKGLFVQILDGRKYWRINKFDFVIWFSTFLSTVFLDIDFGLFIGVGVSLVTVVFQTQFARGYRLGRTNKDAALVELKKYQDAQEIRGIKIFRFQSNLYFANAEIFRSCLYAKTVNPRKLLKFLKKREQRYEKQCRERIAQGLPPEQRRNSVMTGEGLVSPRPSISGFPSSDATTPNRLTPDSALNGSNTQQEKPRRKISASSMDSAAYTIEEGKINNGFSASQKSLRGSGELQTNPIKRHASMDSTLTLSLEREDDLEVDEYGEVIIPDEKLKAMRRVHHIIIDFRPVNYIDSSGSNVLSHIFTEFGHVGVKVYLAGVSSDVRRAMKHAGAFDKIPQENIFLDLQDAIAVARTKPVEALSQQELEDFSDEEAIEDSYVTKM